MYSEQRQTCKMELSTETANSLQPLNVSQKNPSHTPIWEKYDSDLAINSMIKSK